MTQRASIPFGYVLDISGEIFGLSYVQLKKLKKYTQAVIDTLRLQNTLEYTPIRESRDPKVFKYIYQYLQGYPAFLPENRRKTMFLLSDCKYYGIQELYDILEKQAIRKYGLSPKVHLLSNDEDEVPPIESEKFEEKFDEALERLVHPAQKLANKLLQLIGEENTTFPKRFISFLSALATREIMLKFLRLMILKFELKIDADNLDLLSKLMEFVFIETPDAETAHQEVPTSEPKPKRTFPPPKNYEK